MLGTWSAGENARSQYASVAAVYPAPIISTSVRSGSGPDWKSLSGEGACSIQ